MNPFSLLPDEVIDYIFSLVGNERPKLQLVCKRWKQLRFHRRNDLQVYNRNMTNAGLYRLFKIFEERPPCLQKLDLIFCNKLTHQGFIAIPTTVQELVLYGSPIGDMSLEVLATNLVNLRLLNLRYCCSIVKGLWALSSLTNLGAVNISLCKFANFKALESWTSLTKLRSLRIGYNDVSKEVWSHIGKLTQLHFLDIWETPLVVPESLSTLSNLRLLLCSPQHLQVLPPLRCEIATQVDETTIEQIERGHWPSRFNPQN